MSERLSRLEIGGGRVQDAPEGWRLSLPAVRSGYADAQLDDTQGKKRSDFLHRPPAHLSLEARTSGGPPCGTQGFGFWNDPFPSLGGAAGSSRLMPASPQALWFFGRSSPSDLPFAPRAKGTGWCAASLRAPAIPGLAVAGLGAAAVVGMLLPALRPRIRAIFDRHSAAAQADIEADFTEWHRYEIHWRSDRADFLVDGVTVLHTLAPAKGPLGVVIWIDNQWATFSTARGLGFGVNPCGHPTWIEIRNLRLDGVDLEVPRTAA